MPTRELRLILFFLLGLFLGGFAIIASAETIPATPVGANTYVMPTSFNLNGITTKTASSPSGVCALDGYAYVDPAPVTVTSFGSCKMGSMFIGIMANTCPIGSVNTGLCKATGYTCEAGKNWTLSGSNCTRPDCVSPQTMQSDGTCSMPQCASAANAVLGTTRYQTSPSAGLYCVNNCLAYSAGDTNTVNGIKYQQMFVNGAGGAASSCTGSETVPVATPNPTSNHDTPCSQGEGVLTMGGKVQCVPASTPSATSPPVVSTKSSTDTKSDGSKIVTTTNNTCTGDGACSTVTSTTVTNNTAGVAGIAGTPGTSVNAVNSPSSPTSDFCASNPSLQVCKGNMNLETTQKSILDEMKKLSAPDFSDDSALKNAGKFAETDELKEANKTELDAATGAKDPVSTKKDAWAQTMSSGWFSPIPSSNCVPITSKIGTREWVLDICPTAARISELGAYAMWVMLMVSVFVTLTGGKQAT